MSNNQWHIAHKPSRSQSGPCTEDELVLFCIQQKKLNEIVVWKKGMSEWKPIQSVSELQSVLQRVDTMLPQVDEPKAISKKAEYLFDILSPLMQPEKSLENVSSKSVDAKGVKPVSDIIEFQPNDQSTASKEDEVDGRNRRKHERVELRLKAILSNSEQTFMTYTKDISESGLCLEVEAPTHFFKENLDLILQEESSKKRIKFKVNAVLDKNNPKRFFFTGLSEQKKTELMLWIQSTSQNLKAS